MNLKEIKPFRIAAILLGNLIPIIGVLFFEWTMFEVAMTYLLETFIIFFIHEIDKTIFRKDTRLPFIFAFFQTSFLLPVTVGFLYVYSVLIFAITAEPYQRGEAFVKHLQREILHSNIEYLLIALILFESVVYIINNKDGRNHKTAKTWYVMRKILFVHLFIVGSVFLLAFIPLYLVQIAFLIAFKIMLDFAIEDEQFFVKLKTKILQLYQKIKVSK